MIHLKEKLFRIESGAQLVCRLIAGSEDEALEIARRSEVGMAIEGQGRRIIARNAMPIWLVKRKGAERNDSFRWLVEAFTPEQAIAMASPFIPDLIAILYIDSEGEASLTGPSDGIFQEEINRRSRAKYEAEHGRLIDDDDFPLMVGWEPM